MLQVNVRLRPFFVDVLSCDPVLRRVPVRSEPALRKPALDVAQIEMFPQSLNEMVDADDPCRIVSALVNLLDLTPLIKRLSLQGAPSYDPRMMLKLWMFGLLDGERASRRLEKRCRTDIRYKWLAGGLVPDHTKFCRFRKSLGPQLDELLAESVRLGREHGMANLGRVCIDGTKLPGAASQWRRFIDEADAADSDIDEPPPTKPPKKKRIPLPSKDPDAKTLRARNGQFIVGYNAQALAECDTGLVTTVHVSNEASDQGLLEPTLAKYLELSGELPSELIADAGYDTPMNATALAELGIEAFVAPNDHGVTWSLDEEKQPVCPQGHSAVKKDAYLKNGVEVVRYQVKECPSCALRSTCLRSEKFEHKTISHDARASLAHWLGQQERARSEEGKAATVERAQTIELVFARIKEHLKLRRLLMWGLDGAQAEFTAAALTLNLMLIASAMDPEVLRRLVTAICMRLGAPRLASQAHRGPVHAHSSIYLINCEQKLLEAA
jgi:transposase